MVPLNIVGENPSPKNYNFWQPVATFVSLWQLLLACGNFGQLLAICGNLWNKGGKGAKGANGAINQDVLVGNPD